MKQCAIVHTTIKAITDTPPPNITRQSNESLQYYNRLAVGEEKKRKKFPSDWRELEEVLDNTNHAKVEIAESV